MPRNEGRASPNTRLKLAGRGVEFLVGALDEQQKKRIDRPFLRYAREHTPTQNREPDENEWRTQGRDFVARALLAKAILNIPYPVPYEAQIEQDDTADQEGGTSGFQCSSKTRKANSGRHAEEQPSLNQRRKVCDQQISRSSGGLGSRGDHPYAKEKAAGRYAHAAQDQNLSTTIHDAASEKV